MAGELRPLRYQVGYLLDNHGASVPEYQPERDEHRRKQREQGERRIPQHTLPPKIVRLEEKRKEKAEYDRDQRTGRKGQEAQHSPCDKRNEREGYYERENRKPARYRLLLCLGKLDHVAPIIP